VTVVFAGENSGASFGEQDGARSLTGKIDSEGEIYILKSIILHAIYEPVPWASWSPSKAGY